MMRASFSCWAWGHPPWATCLSLMPHSPGNCHSAPYLARASQFAASFLAIDCCQPPIPIHPGPLPWDAEYLLDTKFSAVSTPECLTGSRPPLLCPPPQSTPALSSSRCRVSAPGHTPGSSFAACPTRALGSRSPVAQYSLSLVACQALRAMCRAEPPPFRPVQLK